MNSKILRSVLPPVLLFVVLLVCLPRGARLSYDYKLGQPWRYETIIAPFDFPILKTDEQILQEMSRNRVQVVPYYRFSADIENSNLRAAESLELPGMAHMRSAIVENLNLIYERGIIGDEGVRVPEGSEASELLYVQRGKRAFIRPISEIYRQSDAQLSLLAYISRDNPGINVDSLLRVNAVYALVQPNLIYDAKTTELVAAESPNTVSPTAGYVSAGELIVSEGEIVTAEVAQMLDSYIKEYESNTGVDGPGILGWLGNAVLALVLVGLLLFAVKFAAPELFGATSRFCYLLVVVAIFMLAGIIVPRTEPGLIYMVPFTLCALLLQPFFEDKLILPVYAITLLPILFYSESPVVVFTMFVAAGVVSIYTFRFLGKGWQQFLNALICYAVLMCTYLGFRLAGMTNGGMLRISVYLFVASVLPVAGYPLSYLFERIFNLVSPFRLRELCDTSGALLHEMEQKAPGTFQHSLQVMNMGSYVAKAIGADELLVRAGALYHDIGKTANPLCFVENQSLIPGTGNYHEALTALQSSQDIVRHVPDGVEIAHKHHLPQIIVDFIATHHGTTRTEYFYTKFLNEGGDAAEEAEFRYPGPRPRTREQVILMLCDSIEAASRSLKDYSPKAFDTFVEGIVSGKIEEGQLEDAQITLKDLSLIKTELKNYLSQMYHERIAYPKRNK